uniref:MMS19 nucleotide excision repair protein n=1 Tax=Gongylonema pulchrum TaxID=637853 RepID=A0A183DMF3_9BILA
LDNVCLLLLHILATDASELYPLAKASLEAFCELLDRCPEKDSSLIAVLEIIIQRLMDQNDGLRESALMVCFVVAVH